MQRQQPECETTREDFAALCRESEAEEKCLTLGGSAEPLTMATTGQTIHRVPGTALVFCDSVSEVPPVFTHMLENLPACYETVVLVTVRCAWH